MSEKKEIRNDLIISKYKNLSRIKDLAIEFGLTKQRINNLIKSNLTKEEVANINFKRQVKHAAKRVVKSRARYRLNKL